MGVTAQSIGRDLKRNQRSKEPGYNTGYNTRIVSEQHREDDSWKARKRICRHHLKSDGA
jgi:hypothetical protein